MLTTAIPVDSPNNPDHAGSVLAVTLVDSTGAPVTNLGGGQSSGSTGGQSQFQVATYATVLATNQCVRLDSGSAVGVKSTDVAAPWVDGVVVQANVQGAMGIIAALAQINFTVPVNLPNTRILFLGQDGMLTATPPDRANGDLWSVTVARKTGPNQFILDPQIPIALI